MKKVLSVLLVMVVGMALLVGCSSNQNDNTTTGAKDSTGNGEAGTVSANSTVANSQVDSENTEKTTGTGTGVALSDIKVGVIYVGDENESYSANHMQGVREMKETLGLADEQVIEKTTIPEGTECYDAAVDLVGQGCNIVFANSFGHEDYIIQAASEYPEVQFASAGGYQAAASGLSNMHNFFGSVYEARYITGVIAGMKLQDMIDSGEITADKAKMGYIGAFNYAEVISGYTAFYLGVKSICDSATMEVKYTSSWADMALDKESAEALIADGCVLISQHSDTPGAATVCQDKKVPLVGYNTDMISVAPDYAMTSAAINWAPYYIYAIQTVADGTELETDWCKGYADNAVKTTPLNKNVIVEGTEQKVKEAEEAIKSGKLHVFDTSTFTVNGTSIEKLIEQGGDYAKYKDYVSDGYFHESEARSAPLFDLKIDGITES